MQILLQHLLGLLGRLGVVILPNEIDTNNENVWSIDPAERGRDVPLP